MKGIVVGTAGHVDHGKTTLVEALTGIQTDRWREEKERGLTIDIGFARLRLDDDVETGLVDVPGHEDFLKNMLAGATGIDLLLLVIAADEGPMPQTLEHLSIARLLGIERGVVALTKCDRVDREWLELAEEASRETLREILGHEEWPVVHVSATTGTGLEELRQAIRSEVDSTAERAQEDLFRLPVDRAFSIRGTGTVATGTVWSGRVQVGDEVRVLPADLSARVRALEVHDEARPGVEAGRRCALALVGLEADQVRRGSVLVSDAAWQPTRRIGAHLQLLAHAGRGVEHDQRLRVYLGTREVMARVLLLEGDSLAPGQDGWGILKLEEPLVARVRDRLVLRFYSPVTTIGGGQVVDVSPAALRDVRTDSWQRILRGSDSEALAAAIEEGGGRGVARTQLPIVTGLAEGRIKALSERGSTGSVRLGGNWFAERSLVEAEEAMLAELDALQARDRRASAVSLGSLRAACSQRLAPELVDDTLNRLDKMKRLEILGPRVRRPDHRPSLSGEETKAKLRLRDILATRRLEPPTVPELARELQVDRDVLHDLLLLLREEGAIVPLNAELYVTSDTAGELIGRVRAMLADGRTGTPTIFKEEFGVSRKFLIPMLEYLDREGITRRTGEGRVLADMPEAGQST